MHQFNLDNNKKFKTLNHILSCEINNFKSTINLIGSANYPFSSVMYAHSFPAIANPAEGIVNNRLFPQCQYIDQIENLGSNLVKELFNYDNSYFSSLQIHSGTQANQVVYNAVLEPNDTVLVMDLYSGGHISHHDYLDKFFHKIEYKVDDSELINYNYIYELAIKYKPKLIVAGATSYPREIDYKKIKDICIELNILLLADISHTAIYIANKNHISPFGLADFISLTTHKTTRGSRGGLLIYKKNLAIDIENSIFPITQGAPKVNDIVAKIVMLIELLDLDLNVYVNNILKYTKYFIEYFKDKKFFTDGSDCHLAILNLTNTNIDSKIIEKKLEEINILVNRCPVPNSKKKDGLRFGFLTMATLNINMSDFKDICEIIYNTIYTKKTYTKNDTLKIINKYFN